MCRKLDMPQTSRAIAASATFGVEERRAVVWVRTTVIIWSVYLRKFPVNAMDALMAEISLALDGVLRNSFGNLASGDMRTEDKEFQRYDRSMRKAPGARRSRRTVPRQCGECEFYQPRWKYRSCYYAKCPYHISGSTIREKPLRDNPFQFREVVSMDAV